MNLRSRPMVTTAIRNISVRQEAEKHLADTEGGRGLVEALRASEERYRMLLDGVQDYAIFMMDPQGWIVSWNAGAERIKGYCADEIIGHNFSCFFPPEDVERGTPEEILRKTASSGRHEERGMRVRKDGSKFLASLTFTALRDAEGNLQGFSEFSHDLSESEEAGAKYRGLLEAAPDAMIVVNQSGEIVLLNLQAEKQFGYRRDELVGQKVKNIIPEGFAERLIADGLRSPVQALAQQIGMGIELIALRKDGSEFPIELMLSPLESAEGILVTAAIRNISVRKEADRNLTALERSNTELDDFSYIASHDLKEPLRGIHNHARFLLEDNEGKLDKDSVGRLHRLTFLSQRMETLVNDLLYFSRLGRQKLAVQATDLNAVVRDIEATLDVFLGERSASIAIPKQLPITICDKIRVAELFRNLITNGIKYNDKTNKTIEIGHLSSHGTPNGERFSNVFYVKDNGRGISPEFYEDIFRLFKRLQSTQASEEGTGVGLTFVKKIVARHSGKIWLDSDLGLGTTFYFTLERQSHAAESSSPVAA